MSKMEEALQAVRDFAAENGLNKWQTAVKAGLHVNTLRDMDKETWSPNADTVRALEKMIEEHSA